jgi:GT2 family glycosyltransferase
MLNWSPEDRVSEAITWILPVRNGLPFLRATLESVAGQTHRQQQIIAWDNGSTDGSVDVLRTYIPHRIPGKVVADRPLPLGQCTAAMVELADTALIVHTDQDDVSYPNRIAAQIEFMHKHPEVGFSGSQADFIDGDDRPFPERAYQVFEDDATLRWATPWISPFIHSSMMFRREAALRTGNFRVVPGVAWDDQDMWLRARGQRIKRYKRRSPIR